MSSMSRSGANGSRLRRVVFVGSCVGALLVSGPSTPATATTGSTTEAAKSPPRQAPFPGASSETEMSTLLLGPRDSSGDESAAAVTCNNFETHGDRVHPSGGDVSGHGWWVNISCPASQAVVTIRLQAFYTDGVWRYVGSTGRKTVYSGGGSANWANARARCTSFAYNGYRSLVDVDLVGVNDAADVGITPEVNLPCRL